MSGKNRDLEERYGVEGVQFSKMDSSSWAEDTQNRKNYTENMQEGFRNDYDARRTLEAAALSGKKKAQDILDSGIKSVSDIRNANNFFKKAAKRHGQGGEFSSASDYIGLTQSMVERDRRKLTEYVDSQIDEATGQDEADPEVNANNENLSYNDWRSEQGLETGDPSPSTIVQLDGIDGSRRDEANSFLQTEIEKITAQDRARSRATMGEYTLNQLAGN